MIVCLQADPLNKSRDEDALIAWTWKRYIDMNGTDPTILLRFPMTKVQFGNSPQTILYMIITIGSCTSNGYYRTVLTARTSYNTARIRHRWCFQSQFSSFIYLLL